MNLVTLCGRLTRDPELKYTPSQVAVCKFTLAVDRLVKTGEEKKADFPNVTVFGHTAENLEKFKKKGDMLIVIGRLQTGSYEKDGQTHYTTDVIADRVEFVGGREAKEEPTPKGFSAITEEVPF